MNENTLNTVSGDPVVISSARWFWWIAGLSLVNTVLYYAGSNTSFVMGLALTTIVNVLFARMVALAVLATILIIGFYFVVGLYAQRGRLWAFYTGLAVYVIDALILLKFEDWMSAGFHALAIYFIVRGMMRLRQSADDSASA